MTKPRGPVGRFLHFHSLSLVTIAIVVLWVVLYVHSDPSRRDGAFYGNAIADWSGAVVVMIATKYFFERGSPESRVCKDRPLSPLLDFLRAHSLTIFLLVTGIAWLLLYLHVDPNSKWGQVVGNIVSAWAETLGLVLLTKKLLERGSKVG